MRETNTTAISILGMHRSGTSLVTRVVNLLGAHLGEEKDLMRPTPDNPEGYWEHLQIFIIHEHILKTLRRTWDTVFALPPDWHRSKDIAPFRNKLTKLIETRFDQHSVWAWKDPRSSILLPLWRDVLADLGIELRCLLVFRNPLDVARSLKTRDQFANDEGLGLWLNYNLGMLRNSAGLTRTVTSYEDLLADPAASVARWAPHFPLQWSPDDVAQREIIQGTIRTDLCHSQSTLRDLTRSGAPKPVVALARILQNAAKKDNLDSPAVEKKINILLDDHATLSRLYVHDFVRSDENRHLLQQKLSLAEEELAGVKAHVIEQERALAERDDRFAVADATVQEHEERDAELSALLEEKQRAIAERDDLLLTARADIKEHQDQLVESQELLSETRQALAEHAGLLRSAREENEEHKARLVDLQAWLAGLRQVAIERDELLDATRAETRIAEKRLDEARQHLANREAQHAELKVRLDRLLATYSWRVTRPLRIVLDILKSVGQRLRELVQL